MPRDLDEANERAAILAGHLMDRNRELAAAGKQLQTALAIICREHCICEVMDFDHHGREIDDAEAADPEKHQEWCEAAIMQRTALGGK